MEERVAKKSLSLANKNKNLKYLRDKNLCGEIPKV